MIFAQSFLTSKQQTKAWNYFKTERICTLVSMARLTHDCAIAEEKGLYKTDMERDCHYFSSQPEIYRQIPLEIRNSSEKL